MAPLESGHLGHLAPDAQVVRFYPRRGLGYKLEKDHLALHDADATLCGISLVPGESSGTHVTAPFDPAASYSCGRCIASLRRRGPVRVFSRISYWDDGTESVVAAPMTGERSS